MASDGQPMALPSSANAHRHFYGREQAFRCMFFDPKLIFSSNRGKARLAIFQQWCVSVVSGKGQSMFRQMGRCLHRRASQLGFERGKRFSFSIFK